jgi:nitrous oxidase accessory protein NosD
MRTIVPEDGMALREAVRLAPGVYHLPRGLRVEADGVEVDGAGALLVGSDRQGRGLEVAGRGGVTVRGLRLRDYHHGIYAKDCRGLTLAGNQATSTAEVAPNTVFLDIWKGPEEAYGGGAMLWGCTDATVEGNDLQHQMNGLLTYHCAGLRVLRNQCNYNSGFGIHLCGTCDSLFEENSADYCCRFEPREGPLHFGHMGADATGFLVIRGSCRNVFRRNWARMGGDGFFVAGLAPDMTKAPCNDNLFEENDASLSPNIAFECTFCEGNRFVRNHADRCNFGFWLGFSWNTLIEENRMVMNRQAGIAVENGHSFRVVGNQFQANGHGVLLWSSFVEGFLEAYPEHTTCHHWHIEGNVLTRNGKAIRVAADQDHGIRPVSGERAGRASARPRDLTFVRNDVQDNRVGFELHNVDGALIEANILHRNVEANVRLEDCTGVVERNNLGSRGAYL